MFAVAVHVVAALAVGHKQTELVVKVMLQIAAGFNAPDVGVNLGRRFDGERSVNRINPEVMESFAVPIVIVETAARTIQTIVGHLVHDVIDQVGVLSHGGSGNRLIADHFRRNLCLAAGSGHRVRPQIRDIRQVRIGNIRQIRHFGIGTLIRFHAGVVVCHIVHLQFPFVGVFAGFGIFGFKHVRASANAPDLEGILVALRIVRRLCKQNAFAADIFVRGRIKYQFGGSFDIAVDVEHIGG